MSSNSDTEIDVGISVETGELASGMQHATDVVTSGAEQIKAGFEHINESFEHTKETLLELAGISLSLDWVKESIEQVIELDVAAQHLSETFGLSIDTLSDLNAAAKQADQGLDSAATAMTRLERASAQAQSGSVQFAEAFRAVGVSISDLKSMNPSQLLESVAKSIGEMEPSAERTANMMQLFGRNIAGILPTLKNLVAGAHESAVAFGAVFTEDNKIGRAHV